MFKLDEGELIADTAGVYVQAAGAAAHAAKAVRADGHDAFVSVDLGNLIAALETGVEQEALPRLAPLPDEGSVAGAGFAAKPQPWPVAPDGRTPCVLGVDVGSTSTNLVLVDLKSVSFESNRQKPSWCLAVRTAYFMPASFAAFAQALGS